MSETKNKSGLATQGVATPNSRTGSSVPHVAGTLRRKTVALCCFTAAFLTFLSFATAADQAIPTFNCMSLEWDCSQGGNERTCSVQYRAQGSDTWKMGHPLWWDRVEKQYRGSVVDLVEDTAYEFRLSIPGDVSTTLRGRTWNSHYRIAETITLPAGTLTHTLVITNGGSAATGYKLYKAHPSGTTIDVANAENYCADIRAGFVILQGVTMRHARVHGLRIGNVTDVVIEGCDIAVWGRKDPASTPELPLQVQLDSGIYTEGPDVERIIIQGNRVHHPRYTANDWTQPSPYFKSNHPQGAKAVYFKPPAKGHHVIRFNEFFGDAQHLFNDVLFESDGGTSPSPGNGLVRDSDIHGNLIADCVDDGMEIERGTRNVRIWGNVFDRAGVKTICSCPWWGPYYIFRNVVVRSYVPADPSRLPNLFNWSELRSVFLIGVGRGPNGESVRPEERGMGYIYHNTVFAPPGEGMTFILQPPSKPGADTPVVEGDVWHTLRNNIWMTEPFRLDTNYALYRWNSTRPFMDYDLVNAEVSRRTAAGGHLLLGTPHFQAGSFAEASRARDARLAAGSPGIDGGIPIPNFNDGSAGKAPDCGAIEFGSANLKVGVSLWRPSDAKSD